MSVMNNETNDQSATIKSNVVNTPKTKQQTTKKNVQVHLNRNLINALDKHIDELSLQRSKILEVLIAEYLFTYSQNKKVATKKTEYQYLFDGKLK